MHAVHRAICRKLRAGQAQIKGNQRDVGKIVEIAVGNACPVVKPLQLV